MWKKWKRKRMPMLTVALVMALVTENVPAEGVLAEAAVLQGVAKKAQGFTISKPSGSYVKQVKTVVKAKKGYQVFYTTTKKFYEKKKISAQQKKRFTIRKKTTLKLIAIKTGKKITTKQLNSRKFQKKVQTYAYRIKTKDVTVVTNAPTNTEIPASTSSGPSFEIKDGVLLGGTFDGLKTISIPEGVKKIADRAFEFDRTVESVIFPKGLVEIGESAFNECTRLKRIKLSNTVEKIGDYAFFQCTSLKRIGESEALSEIGEGAFYGCSSLQEAGIEDSVTKVGDYAFGECDSLTYCYIGTGLTELPNQLFVECDHLKTATIPKNMKVIGRKAFWNCVELKTLTLEGVLDEIKESAFRGCYALEELKVDAKIIGKQAFAGTSLKSVEMGETCETLEERAFMDCMDLETISLPKNMKVLGENVFQMSGFKSVEVAKDNPSFVSLDGVLYSKDRKELLYYPKKREEKTYLVPEGTESIGRNAFESVELLETVVLSSSVKEIKEQAFLGGSMTEITFSKGLESIGESAFANVMLKKITLPDSVRSMESGVLRECYDLEEVVLGAGLTEIPANTFSGDMVLKKVVCPEGIQTVGAGAFDGCYALHRLQGVEFQNQTAFQVKDGFLLSGDGKTLFAYYSNNPIPQEGEDGNDIEKVTELTIPDGVETIAEGAFGDSDVETLMVPASVKKMESQSFGYMYPSGYQLEGTVMIGQSGSEAERYARKNGVAFFTDTPSQNVTEISLKQGESQKFEIHGITPDKLFFTSGNAQVVSVDAQGNMTAKAKGQTSVVAAVETKYFSCKVTVTEGKEPKEDKRFSGYSYVTEESIGNWETNYLVENGKLLLDESDFPATLVYSSDKYSYIVGCYFGEGSSYFQSKVLPDLGEDYGQYRKIGENLSRELRMTKLSSNLLSYSGTNNLSVFTGGGSSLMELKALEGKQITDNSVISTSLDHRVSDAFGQGAMHTVLEIYAEKDNAPGMYIAGFSKFPSEVEFLYDRNVTYEIMEVGVRVSCKTKWYVDGTEGIHDAEDEMCYERYVKMKVV